MSTIQQPTPDQIIRYCRVLQEQLLLARQRGRKVTLGQESVLQRVEEFRIGFQENTLTAVKFHATIE